MASALDGLARDLADWLATLGAELAETIRTAPGSTIVPSRTSAAGRDALLLLQRLAGSSPLASAQLARGEVIAEGGMGQIQVAEQVALGRTVAVKTLKPGRRDPTAALELLREAWLTGAVEHPNVVPIHHLGLDDDGLPMIVLRRVEGVEWAALLDDADAVRERFGATDLLVWNLGILMQVLGALHSAHSRGIVHRDLKPTNVMIGRFGEVYLLDWGLAVSLHDDGSGRLPLAADQHELAGTPCYMAPEMLGRGDGPGLSVRTDVYLAGAVLFELLAGAPPHDGDSAVAVIASVVASRPELPPSAPAELARICARAMQPDPDARYASAEALRQALQAYLEHRGSQRLAELATERLAQLRALVAAASDPARQREEVYRLFGACRFGFHEALAAWRDNQEARAGMTAAAVAVAELELRADDPRAAVSLLSSLDDPPADLLARARAAAAEQATQRAALERLRAQHDPTIGTRTRTFLIGVLGVLFTGVPLVTALFPERMDVSGYPTHVGWSIAFLLVVAGLGVWARESMMKTVLNRRTFATMLFLFVAQGALFLAAWRLGLDQAHAQVLMVFLWFVICGMAVIAIDRRLLVGALGFGAAFVVALARPDLRLFAAAGGNFVFAVTAVVRWRPGAPGG